MSQKVRSWCLYLFPVGDVLLSGILQLKEVYRSVCHGSYRLRHGGLNPHKAETARRLVDYVHQHS